jgi:hypothetical protein
MAAKKVAPAKKRTAKKVVAKAAAPAKKVARKKVSTKTPPKVNVDTAQARYDALLAAMQTHGVHESRSWDAYWEAVDEVLSGKLYLLSSNPEEHMAEGWCLAHTKQGADACRRNALVARFCSPDDELRYGVSKLFSVLRYIDKKVSPLPEQGALKLKLESLRFALVRDGKKVSVGIEDATVKEIDALANDRAAGPKPSPLALPFERAFKKVRGFEESRFIVRDGQLSVRNIPLAHLETFMKLMRGVDWESALPK